MCLVVLPLRLADLLIGFVALILDLCVHPYEQLVTTFLAKHPGLANALLRRNLLIGALASWWFRLLAN
jgi:hypothetical protein